MTDKLNLQDHPFLQTENVKYSDWFGQGSSHEDYAEAVGDGPAPDEVLVDGCMLLLIWPTRAICIGYDGNEYYHQFSFERSPPEKQNVPDYEALAEAFGVEYFGSAEWLNVSSCTKRAIQRALTAALRTSQSDRQDAREKALREAAKPFVAHYEPWMDEYSDDAFMSVWPRVTFGQVRTLRAAILALITKEADNAE